jgi:hypothetical protein
LKAHTMPARAPFSAYLKDALSDETSG